MVDLAITIASFLFLAWCSVIVTLILLWVVLFVGAILHAAWVDFADFELSGFLRWIKGIF